MNRAEKLNKAVARLEAEHQRFGRIIDALEEKKKPRAMTVKDYLDSLEV